MEKPTMAGYILDQGRALRQSFAERACFVDNGIKLSKTTSRANQI